jgi:hypothetical protein
MNSTHPIGMRRSKRWTCDEGELSFLARESLFSPVDGAFQCSSTGVAILGTQAGVWLSASLAYRERSLTSFPPINCRNILEMVLGVDVTYRRRPHELFRRMYAMADPRLLRVPINTTWRRMFSEKARWIMSLPWRKLAVQSFSVGRSEAGDKSSDAARAHRYTRQTGLSAV